MGAENGLGRWLQVRDQGVSDEKRSFFFKEYLTHFILIVVAFTLAGSVFYHQMASYALRAKQTELKTTVQSLAEQSKLMQGTDSDVIRELYMLSIARIAKEDELTVLVTNESGEVADGGASGTAPPTRVSGYRVPAEVVSEVHTQRQLCRGRFGRCADRGDELHSRQLRARH
ncbi:MAG: hypothetical protein ACLR4Z_15105 [Butyricicoccaceae bacterium]